MNIKEKIDSLDPASLPGIEEKTIPADSKRRIEKLVMDSVSKNEQPVIKRPRNSFGRRLTSLLATAAAVAGVLAGVRVATLPGDGSFTEKLAAAFKRGTTREEVVDPHSESLNGGLTEGGTTVKAEKIYGDGEYYYLDFKVNCPEIPYRFILHGGIKLEQNGVVIYEQKGPDLSDLDEQNSQNLIYRTILAGDILADVTPGDTSFDFQIRVAADKLTDGDYYLTLGGLLSVDLEFPDDKSANILAEQLSGEMLMPLTISLPETLLDKTFYTPQTKVTIGDEKFGLTELSVNEVTITPLKLYMKLSVPYAELANPGDGFATAESYIFTAKNTENDGYRYTYILEYYGSDGGKHLSAVYNQSRLTMTDAENIPFDLTFDFREPLEASDIIRVVAIPFKDIPYDSPTDPDCGNAVTIWENPQ